jgi:AraC-like DNA-binding protein
MFAVFFILLFIAVNTGNLLLYAFFSRILVSEIHSRNLEMLTKIKNATELMYNEVVSVSVQLGHSNITLTRVMFETERDRILEYQAHQVLRNTLVSYPYIAYFAIYNERLNELIGTRYFSRDTEAALKSMARGYYQGGKHRLTIPLTVEDQLPFPERTRKDTITLLVYSPLSLEYEKGVLLLGIDCDYFRQLISRMDEESFETFIILHENSQVISHPDSGLLLADYSGNEFVLEIDSYADNSGFFIRNIEGINSFVSYTRSELLGWTFINTIPYNKITTKLVFLRNITFVITLIILCAGIVTSYLLARKMYRPMQRILNRLDYKPGSKNSMNADGEIFYIEKQLDYLRSTAKLSEPAIRGSVVFDLLKNQYIDNDIINSRVLESAFTAPYYMVCVFSYDRQEGFEKLNTEKQGGMRGRLIKIAGELIKTLCVSMDYAVVSPRNIAVLLHMDIGAIPKNLGPAMAETVEMVKKFNGLTVSASAGHVVNSIFAINDSFEEAMLLLAERFFLGPETVMVLKNDRIPETLCFPQHIMDNLNNSVVSGETGKIKEAIKELSESLETADYEHARMHLNTAVMQLLSFFLVRKIPVNADSFHALNGSIQNTETLKEACALFLNFCLSLEGGVNKGDEKTMPRMVRDGIKLAAQRYQDPAFSLNTAAELSNITPAYFNRVFKKYKQISYTEFLNHYRMERACVMLRETSEPVNSIANAVGISNVTYFYTLFKKTYNRTPQQFRNSPGAGHEFSRGV